MFENPPIQVVCVCVDEEQKYFTILSSADTSIIWQVDLFLFDLAPFFLYFYFISMEISILDLYERIIVKIWISNSRERKKSLITQFKLLTPHIKGRAKKNVALNRLKQARVPLRKAQKQSN